MKWISLLMLLHLLFSTFPQTANAELVKSAHFPATRKDHFYQFWRSIYSFSAFLHMMHGCSGEDDFPPVSEALPLAERNRLRKSKTRYVSADKNADEFLFDDPRLFDGLLSAGIQSEAYNETYLRALALNYPDIQLLAIVQDKPLSDAALKSLKSFKNLLYLELACPVQSPDLLRAVLPQRIMELSLHDTAYQFPDLPDLLELTIDNCRLDQNFVDRLKASNLERLKLHRVNVAAGAFKDIARFKHLREIDSYNSDIDSVDVECLQRLPYAETTIQTH